ncbi:unnamed protein product [Parnassius apollo]|uniref:(apollo) hypothetical protein n=1 Tax=Parnassius apollo TaxID=110799 RepID=A0A8S3WUR0_PARAO|nr:unnamed protein product [Parnassius apollo]
MEIEILSTIGSKSLGKITLNEDATVKNVKEKIYQNLKKSLYPERQSIKLEAKGKSLKDETTLKSINVHDGAKLFVSDLGPQVSYKNVFLAEYAGPLFVYLWVYQRPWIFYGEQSSTPGTVAK